MDFSARCYVSAPDLTLCPQIQWYRVSKSYEGPSGCDLIVVQSESPAALLTEQQVLFAATYQGPLPGSARDAPFARWVQAG